MSEPIAKPPFIAKAALFTGRAMHQPFEVPGEMTVSAANAGNATNALIAGTNAAMKESIESLQPRGPAKWLMSMFDTVDASVARSAGQAKTAAETFWIPFSEGSHQVGFAASNPLAKFYADKVGIALPDDAGEKQAILAQLVDSKGYPLPAPPEEPAPAPKPPAGDPPPADGPPADGGGTPPPSDGPPADGPPADGPPADGGGTPPPADGPPADGPPADGPPADGPPAEGPPAE